MSSFLSKEFFLHNFRKNDREYNWFGPDNEKNYDEKNNLYSKNDIIYKFNKHGFRCDEFELESPLRVVFIGCSISEGIGIKLEESYTHLLLQKIKQKFNLNIPFWNLSLCGCGLDSLLRAYYHFYDVLKPDYVIGYFPIYRKEFYNKKRWDMCNILDPRQDVYAFYTENYVNYEISKNFLLLHTLLQKYNTTFFWNTWDKKNQYPNIDNKFFSEITFDDSARDKMHPGPTAHYYFAENIWKEIEDKIKI